jgi:hypothetical protein
LADGPGGSALSGKWFDSRDYQMPVSASIRDTTFLVECGTPEIEQGRTHYQVAGKELIVTDEALVDVQYNKFGRIRYQRLQDVHRKDLKFGQV